MYTLVVVDMQSPFTASRKPSVVKQCQTLIKKAVKDKAAILFVEYQDYGKTDTALTKLAKDYQRAYHVIKNNDDGSREVIKTINAKRLPKQNLRVCGVNTAYCVLATVLGLTKRLHNTKIEVVAKACNSCTSTAHSAGLRQMRQISKVKIQMKGY